MPELRSGEEKVFFTKTVIKWFTHATWGGAMVLGKLPVPGRPTIWI